MVNPFILHVPPLTHLPSSARSCFRRSTIGMAAKELSPDNNDPIQSNRCQCIFTGDHDAQEDFYTRLGAHDGTPRLPSHLTTLLQQCVTKHS
ncbi:hypothetical protein [Absidia glauca]|uniref:Ndc10 domain-containing protein n=1 Tax=Absidia glauca TaxID=4829 RepID=A0A163JVE9_ABSGL|nr:hypothetical protein [Absidia glauca]